MKNKGFTLIELVVVIVILGILAVTAAPKFLSLQKDARVSVLEGTKAAIEGASDMVHGIALLEAVDSELSSAVNVGENEVKIALGRPLLTEEEIRKVVSLDLNILDIKNPATKDEKLPALPMLPNLIAIYDGSQVDSLDKLPRCHLAVAAESDTGLYRYEFITDDC